MRTIQHTLISILFIPLLLSCEQTAVNVDLPAFNAQLVITSFISPDDSIISVSVSYDRPIYGQTFESNWEDSAKVIISDGESSFNLKSEGMGSYKGHTKDYPLSYGKTYALKVDNQKGKIATASCTIPKYLDLHASLDSDSIPVISSYSDQFPTFYQKFGIIKFTDIANEPNYYKIFAYYVSEGYSYSYNNNLDADSVIKKSIQNLSIDTSLLDDKKLDGKEIKRRFRMDGYFTKSYQVEVYILNTDRDYYLYHKSLKSYTQGDVFTEPTLVYSNVNGGIGIFASYTKTSLVIKGSK